ncbi:ATP-binding protein [Pseudoduganella albidiflava]|uniref:Adenylate cyclase n=1 Tax=Pseudoduganella albidiflava TaxID=321983 RepID=A0A411WX47_9BURK|nr:AAA family ATPase [Pseudoduganella albidiflava]QBI01351.1 XRE family transcriptional regulator [Pseudoduganella albidiflava]GGY36340.1 adenylate cyclase [Pseudoduganella albidiflava]
MDTAQQHDFRAVQDGRVTLDARRLKALRQQRGLSQEALARLCFEQRLCVSIASIKRAETSKSVLYRTASHLARVFGSDIEALVAGPQEQQQASAPDAGADQEVRSVVILELPSAPLPEETLAAIRQLVLQFGGSLAAHGLAVFGLPKAYRSDALRCVQCAVELAQLLRGRHATLLIGSGDWPPPERRPTAALPDTPGDGALFGPGTVLVERSLSLQLRERFVFAPSLAMPGHVRLLHSCHSERVAQYPLIGRYVEIGQFKAALDSTQTYQTGHICYLRGVAGIGKSRLMSEFIEIAEQGQFDCHVASVLDFGQEGDAAPLRMLARNLFALPRSTANAGFQLGEQMRRLQLDEALTVHYHALLGLAPPPDLATVYAAMTHATRRQFQVAALRQLIMRRAIERPVLLAVEDIHWGNAELLETLGELLQDVQEAPVIWLLSSRFEQDPLESTLRPYLNGSPLTVCDLPALRNTEAQTLAMQFGSQDADFHAQCIASAQGNPLFLTQLLQAGRSGGVPSSLKNLVQTKLDQLPAPCRTALRAASALGQRFSLDLLRQLTGDPACDMDLPLRHHLVRRLARDEYLFVHDLVMQRIYESLPERQRTGLHAAIGALYAGRDAVLSAQHYHRARHPAAPAAFLAAIREQMAAYQYFRALELIRQCQEVDYAGRDDFELCLLSGRCHAKMGETQRAKACFADARMLAPDDRRRIAAVIGLAQTLNVLEDMTAEEALLDETIPLAVACGDDAGLAELYYLKGNIYFPQGRFARSRGLHEQAQYHARRGNAVSVEARALSGIGDSYYGEGRMRTAYDVFDRCLGLCEQHALTEIEASNRFMRGTARIYLNQSRDALEDALQSAELGARVGNRRAEIVSRLTAGWVLLADGQVPAARVQVETGLELARKIGAARFEPFLNESLARVLLLEGQPAAAHEAILSAWRQVEQLRLERFIGPWVVSTLATLEPDRTLRDEALQRGATLIEQGCVAHNVYRYYVNAIEARLLHDELDAARALASAFADFVSAEPCPWAAYHLELARHWAACRLRPDPSAMAALEATLAAGRAAGLGWVMPRLNLYPRQAPLLR